MLCYFMIKILNMSCINSCLLDPDSSLSMGSMFLDLRIRIICAILSHFGIGLSIAQLWVSIYQKLCSRLPNNVC